MSPIEYMFKKLKNLHIGSKSTTKAGLVDALKECKRQILPQTPTDKLYEYSSLFLPVSEMGVLVSAHDLEFLATVNDLFDNPMDYRERRRHVNGGKETALIHPQLNLLIGAQPNFLSSILPEEAWQMGTTSRFIMIYADGVPQHDLFDNIIDRDPLYDDLAKQLAPWTDLRGQMQWHHEAVEMMRSIVRDNFLPVPDHPKLETYTNRRVQFLIKLSMVSTMSRTGAFVIEALDVVRAREWMLNAEQAMPGIFNAMTGKSDRDILAELHMAVWREWKREKDMGVAQPYISTNFLYNFLQDRIYVEKIPKIIDAAVKGRLIDDRGGGLYVPVPRVDWTGRGAKGLQ